MDKKKNKFLRISIVILLLLSFLMIYLDSVVFADGIVNNKLTLDFDNALQVAFKSDLLGKALVVVLLLILAFIVSIVEIIIIFRFRKMEIKYLYKINLMIFSIYIILNLFPVIVSIVFVAFHI